MSDKKTFFNSTFWITCAVCLMPLALGFYLWEKLPEEIPMQYGWNGQVNWTLPKAPAVFACPAVCLVLNIIMQVSFYLKGGRISRKTAAIFCWIIPVLSVAVNSFIILKPAGLDLSAEKFVLPLCSIFFIIIGNYLPKTEPNHIIGIRAPWINKNPEVWRKTNRIAGILFVAAGIINLAAAFTEAGKYIFVSSIIAVWLFLLVYSIIIAKKEAAEEGSAGQ